jgi:hypothetical protein
MRWLIVPLLISVCACSEVIQAGDQVGAELPAASEVFAPESEVSDLAWVWPWNQRCEVQHNIPCGLGGGRCAEGTCAYTREADCTRTYYCIDSTGEKNGKTPRPGCVRRPREGINPPRP